MPVDIAWGKLLPVFVSIAIIILVAILREQSRTLAAIIATMPINVPLALWIISAGGENDRAAMTQFTEALLINIWPSVLFLVIAWFAARAGWGLLALLGASYTGWGLGLGVILILRQFLTS